MRPLTQIDRNTDRTAEVRILLAASSIAAGVIHAAVVPEHVEEASVFGVFFILAAAFQIAWAIRVGFGRPSAVIYAAGALANCAMIAIWLVSRTTGLPIGPEPWMAEPAGMLDVTATFLGLLLVAGSLLLLRVGPDADGHHVTVDLMRLERAAPGRVATVEQGAQPNPRPPSSSCPEIAELVATRPRGPMVRSEERR